MLGQPMTDDPIGSIFLIVTILFGYWVAFRPASFVKIMSYGRRGISEVNPTVLRFTRFIAGAVALSGTFDILVWLVVKK